MSLNGGHSIETMMAVGIKMLFEILAVVIVAAVA